MAKNYQNERLTLQCVAIGSMIIMAGAAAAHLMKAVRARRTARQVTMKRAGSFSKCGGQETGSRAKLRRLLPAESQTPVRSRAIVKESGVQNGS
jgi:hypothetical protein